MAVTVKLCCSECETMRDVPISAADKEIFCPMCGRKAPNLSDTYIGEIETVLKKQRIFNWIALWLVVAAVVCAIFWVNPDRSTWLPSAKAQANVGLLVGFGACGLGAVVFACLGAFKRYLIEF